MNEFFEIMLYPALACLLLTVTHAYLGFHVLERGVIFVDLALAQLAALGATLGYALGYALHSNGSYVCSLVLTLFGAAVFALSRTGKPRVPQEAVIGIVYAVAGAAAVLALHRVPEGGEELKNLLVGHLLFVDGHEVVMTAVLYGAICVVHYLCRHTFFAISLGSYSGSRLRLWDFVFYATFGVVVTSSVELAGVLLVFAFLVCPAACGAFVAQGIRPRLFVSWTVSIVVTLLGMSASYFLDWPTGATVVVCFGIFTLFFGLVSVFRTGTPT